MSESEIKLYQIAYSNESLLNIEPGYLTLDNIANERPDWYEYWPIRNFLLNNELDENIFYGFFSPKFSQKTGLNHTQVTNFIREQAALHDVILFSPQPDMGAFFLNVFEQGEVFDPGLIEATEGFLHTIGYTLPLSSLVMDSSQIIFSNYFAAKAPFWRRWLQLTEQFFSLCEGPDSDLKARCTVATTYPNSVQRKVFILERLASLLLVTEPHWRTKAANPFQFAWSMARFREHPIDAFISDALKIAYRLHGYPEYIQAYAEVRRRFSLNSTIPPST